MNLKNQCLNQARPDVPYRRRYPNSTWQRHSISWFQIEAEQVRPSSETGPTYKRKKDSNTQNKICGSPPWTGHNINTPLSQPPPFLYLHRAWSVNLDHHSCFRIRTNLFLDSTFQTFWVSNNMSEQLDLWVGQCFCSNFVIRANAHKFH